MAPSLYLINPRSASASYFGAEVFEHWGLPATQAIADLATVTVAALAPSHWRIDICEEHAEEIDFDHDADFIGITGYVNQLSRMREVAAQFRARGKKVLIGGPQASLDPDAVRDSCDVLVIGELEEIAGELFADLESGDWKAEYVAEKPDLKGSPLPRWDLYPNGKALIGCVQTSRGCPFSCEFCDVIVYLGRKQRHKDVDQILAELDQLYELGYTSVFLADDNFTSSRKRTKELLVALRDWNMSRPEGPMAFSTQLSIDAAKDVDLIRSCGEAGIAWVFIGIESPNEESLKETGKRQNVGVDLLGQVQVFLDHGISVSAGLIAGFDHDGLDIFDRLYDFSMASPIPFFSLGALNAPVATPLHARLKAAGRLVPDGEEMSASPWETNIYPGQMSREELFAGLRRVCNRMYRPKAFGERVIQMIDRLGPQIGPFQTGMKQRDPRSVEKQALSILRKLFRLGPEEREMWRSVSNALAEKPETGPAVMMMLFRYAQARCLYDQGQFWDPSPTPGEAVASSTR